MSGQSDLKQRALETFQDELTKAQSLLQDKEMALRKNLAPVRQQYATAATKWPAATLFFSIFIVLAFVPSALFLTFAASTGVFLLLTAVFWFACIVGAAASIFLFSLGICIVSALTITFWLATAYLTVRLFTNVREQATVQDGFKNTLTEAKSLLLNDANAAPLTDGNTLDASSLKSEKRE